MTDAPGATMTVGLSLAAREPGMDVAALYHRPGVLRALLRDAMAQGGVPKDEAESAFATIVPRDASVLVKPNWVNHFNPAGHGMDCVVTHPEFIAAVVEELATARPGRIVVADAPIQSCDWDTLVPQAFRERIIGLGARHGVAVEFRDFRKTVVHGRFLEAPVVRPPRPADRYALFDLGGDSLLEPLTTRLGFRAPDYDHRRLAEAHANGMHKYLICKEIFEADVVVSLPKLKVHKKAGITGAIKTLVGVNGDKDYLAHARAGGGSSGGDLYEGRSLSHEVVAWLRDRVNMHRGHLSRVPWLAGVFLARNLLRVDERLMDGNWYGNDTCWRMSLDLNRIASYGRADGSLADAPQRTIHTLTDAIVCGQGDAPLKPHPMAVGAVTYASNSVACEVANAALLGLDFRKLPIIREAFSAFRWPLVEPGAAVRIRSEGRDETFDELVSRLGNRADAPPAWHGYIEWEPPPGISRAA